MTPDLSDPAALRQLLAFGILACLGVLAVVVFWPGDA